MKRTTTTLTILTIICLGLIRCYYNKEDQLYPPVSSGCDTTNVRYSTKVTDILSRNCYICHGSSVAASIGGGVKLDNYADVKTHTDHIYGAITHQDGYPAMPKDRAMLDSCKIKVIKIWLDAGAPNN